jgi:uracil-DNA glycosylase family 4
LNCVSFIDGNTLVVTIQSMSDDYHQMLDATILHLEELKSRGVRFVPVSPEALAALNQAPAIASSKRIFAAPMPERRSPTRPVENQTIPNRAGSQTGAPIVVTGPVEQKPPGGLSFAPGLTGATQAAPAPALSSEAKAAAFADLRQRALACVKCPHLASSRKNVVFGVGSIDAQLMFIGEAPGADEDEQGEPFVGKAGQLLTKIIQTMGLQRRDVYIGNILKCRPDTPGQSAGNRKPTSEEMQTCIPFLHEQIDLIRPKVIVALGTTAVEGLLGKTIGIVKLRGTWKTYRNIPLMPTYHPAYLLRNQALSLKRWVWEDMLQVMEAIALPISEKQKNFFLNKVTE